MDSHITQMLSGHGCFGTFLCRIGKEPTSGCHHCLAVSDDVKHTLYDCPSWITERATLENAIKSQLTEDSLVPSILSSPVMWKAFAVFIICVLTTKGVAETEREAFQVPGPVDENRKTRKKSTTKEYWVRNVKGVGGRAGPRRAMPHV